MTEWNLCRFAKYYSRLVTSPDTVSNVVYTLKSVNELMGYGPVQTTKLLKWLLKGLKREMARATKQATPMNPAILKRIRSVVNMQDLSEVVAFALCLVGFFLFLRASNMVPPTRAEFDAEKQLTRQDFRMGQDAIVVDIKWSKTIQFKQKLLQVPLLPVADEDICPVFWVQKVFRLIPAGPLDPAFGIPDKGKITVLSYSQLNTRLQRWLGRLGLPRSYLTPHSMRHGGATYAGRVNICAEAVKLIGDWASDAYKLYMEWSFKRRFEALKKMAVEAPKHACKDFNFSLSDF